MIESPLVQGLVQELLDEARSEKAQACIGTILQDRFGAVPAEVGNSLKTIHDDATLDSLLKWAVRCPDLEAFRVRLASR